MFVLDAFLQQAIRKSFVLNLVERKRSRIDRVIQYKIYGLLMSWFSTGMRNDILNDKCLQHEFRSESKDVYS